MFDELIKNGRAWVVKHKLVSVGVSLLAVGLSAFLFWSHSSAQSQALSDALTLSSSVTTSTTSSAIVQKTESAEKGASETESGKIVVDIKGAVKTEGVYELAQGSRVTDVVRLAGGFNEQADKKSVNLAAKLTDEQVIYVASVGENVSVVPEVSAQEATSAAGISTSQSDSSEKINLNTATVADLQTISGIGEKRAQDIIDYRDANGGFTAVEDLKNISGIGDKTFEKIAAEVTLD